METPVESIADRRARCRDGGAGTGFHSAPSGNARRLRNKSRSNRCGNNRQHRKALDRVRVVLTGAKEPGNVGSVARAMKNMGLSRLYLVDPPDHTCGDRPKDGARFGRPYSMAPTVCESLEEALSGTVLSVGTTHRKREHFDVMYGPRHAAEKLVSLPGDNEAALVFGREENGLTNDEMRLCSIIANIPTAHRYPSLNLSPGRAHLRL